MSLEIDNKIQISDRAICRHIDKFEVSGRGVISQDILNNLRDFVEHIMLKIFGQGCDINDDWQTIPCAIKYLKSKAEWKDLTRFHNFLQISVSHYTISEENSERLMLKYYVYLLKIKKLMNDRFSFEVLKNLDKFPMNTDTILQEYYDKVAVVIGQQPRSIMGKSNKYYIQKIKPFFCKQQIFYEVTFKPANDYESKFNRVIAFTALEITDFYAVKLSLITTSINVLEKTMPITVITGWEVAIRDCEFKNFSRIVCGLSISTGYSEQLGLCRFLTQSGLNLSELINFSDEGFQKVKKKITQKSKKTVFFNDLEKCHKIINEHASGSNLLSYLLYHMNNIVIKNQIQSTPNNNLSGLYMQNKCIPFDHMPFNFSPVGHNPKLGDLFACIDATGRQHEILARFVRNNTEIQGKLFSPVQDTTGFDNIQTLVSKYNSSLWSGHIEPCKLCIKYGHIFINGYVNDTCSIIKELINLAKNGVRNYENSVNAWFNLSAHGVDCNEKKEVLRQLFINSKVALVYGAAGTGKSTIINHVAHFFADKKKLFLAQTNSAVDNLRRRVTATKCTFLTITKFLKNSDVSFEYDLLVIDECSTVNNRDMRDILDKAKYMLLVLVGDTYQIESIRFGNWFSIARFFIPNTSVFELIKPYRSKNPKLLTLWEKVRKMDPTILEFLDRQDYSMTLNASIFESYELDEIILCLNYDGLYGINNINRLLQENNLNVAVLWGLQHYKVGDPILFTTSDRFSPVIYNNMKGHIVKIEILDNGNLNERIQFDVELNIVINGMDAFNQDFELIENLSTSNSVIRFCVYKTKNADDDDDDPRYIIPFQIAYAVSIHKAQGLEYSSVKIVITDEIDELITHNIFYTAITRAKSRLKIYWTPEVENKVLANIIPRNNRKDVELLKKYL